MTYTPGHVSFRGVTKRYADGPPVLEAIDLAIAQGEFVALIGPSGCGKSTLLRLIAGLSPLSTGQLEVDGRPPERGRAGTAFIFQDPTLLPWLRVGANIEVPLRLGRVPVLERRSRTAEMLRRVQLTPVLDQFPRQLSGGMRMRVSVARALVQKPQLLLLDEPFGALDELTRQRLNEELLELRSAHNWTAIFVTHSVAEAVFLSGRVLVMAANPGRIVSDIPIPFDYPRRFELRQEPAFHAMVDTVSQSLRQAEGSVVA